LASRADAQAWTSSGNSGNVAVQPATANGNTNQITLNFTVIGESLAWGAYSQYVCNNTRFLQLQSTSPHSGPPVYWQLGSHRRCGWIAPNQTYLPDYGVTFTGVDNRGYRLVTDITWQLADGRQIGAKSAYFTHVGDYQCAADYQMGAPARCSRFWDGAGNAFVEF